MSVHADEAMDSMFHTAPPSPAEHALVQSFRWGNIDLPKLWHELRLRAPYICAHYGIMVSRPSEVREEPAATPMPILWDLFLQHVPTEELLAELDRRSSL